MTKFPVHVITSYAFLIRSPMIIYVVHFVYFCFGLGPGLRLAQQGGPTDRFTVLPSPLSPDEWANSKTTVFRIGFLIMQAESKLLAAYHCPNVILEMLMYSIAGFTR